ncbi:MAG: SRPBCC family protein [Vulcanimicrobiaceae bacterium]
MNDLATFISPGTLRFERELPGPIDRVWDYLTKTELLATWFDGGTIGTEVGADATFTFGMHGRITVYEPPHVLEYTWNEPETSTGPIVDTLVRWELQPRGEQVLLTLTHSRIATSSVAGFGAGWHAGLAGLDAALSGTPESGVDSDYAALAPLYDEHVASHT